MRALAAGELQRVLSRRMVRVLALLAVAGIALTGILTFLNTDHVSESEMRARRQAAAAAVDACASGPGPVNVDGREIPDPPPPGSQSRKEFCEFAAGRVDDPRFELRSLKGILQGTPPPSWSWPG